LCVSDAVQRRFPEKTVGKIRQAMRQKCSNAVKAMRLKDKPVQNAEPTAA